VPAFLLWLAAKKTIFWHVVTLHSLIIILSTLDPSLPLAAVIVGDCSSSHVDSVGGRVIWFLNIYLSVVPYNMQLLKKYNAHINADTCLNIVPYNGRGTFLLGVGVEGGPSKIL
ncbi:hypothetical protein ACJX0J_034538, partial [Zea mays]